MAMAVTYALQSLGWKGFQDLCTTITREIWGQTIQQFFDSNDAGRDGGFRGTWKQQSGESFSGSFTVQCKFTAKADKSIKLADVSDELIKATQLAASGVATNYILMTNARLTGASELKLRRAFLKIPKIQEFAAYGSEWIAQTIHESARLRMLVPRVYGLGDLSQIMDDRAYAQAQEILSAFGDDLGKFVITDAFRRSARAILDHGFVLLLGQPASGKSTIAAALSVGALDNWKCSTLKVRDADEFVRHSNPHEPHQFFWVDDAFGATQLDWASVSSWNSAFAHMHAAIRRGARVVFTSRDYVYRAARKHLKESAFPLMKESQVVIDVERLQKVEKEQILYNHIRLGTQTKDFRRRIKPFLPDVAASPGFIPEIARRLGSPLFTKTLSFSTAGLAAFVENPVELLMEVILNLDTNARAALTVIFMRGGGLKSPIQFSANESKALSLLGSTIAKVRESLSELEGSLTLRTLESGSYLWRFKHPTIRDALASLIAEDTELVDIYLAGTPLNTLLSEVSCGDVGIEGVKVIVPRDRYEVMSARLDTIDITQWEGARALHQFLSYRCDKNFLERYILTHSKFVEELRTGSYLSVVSDVAVILRLEELKLLPEEKRQRVVAAIRDLAVNTPDADFLGEKFACLFHGDEMKDILREVRERLIPNLDEEICNWRSNIESDDDPETYFDSFVGALHMYADAFSEDGDATSKIRSAVIEVEEVINELESERETFEEDDSFPYGGGSNIGASSMRSIFDDVDG
jgi:conflict system STAND superfamily ATPase